MRERVWRVIDAGVQAAAQSLPAQGQKCARVLRGEPRALWAGESSFIGETLTRLGVRNMVPASLGPFPRLNPEFVVRANPDLIMIGNRSMQGMVPYPGWASMRAMREQRLCVFHARRFRRAGPPRPAHGRGRPLMAALPGDKAPPGACGAFPGGGRHASERSHHAGLSCTQPASCVG
jgi:iron complex transport system substrate-binding protein